MRRDKTFGVTTAHFSKPQDERKKYILAYEGSKTEAQYFNAIIQNCQDLNISPLIHFVPLLRSTLQETEGHPKRVVDLIEEHLEHYHSVKVFLDKLVDFCAETMQISANSVYSTQMLRMDMMSFFESKNLQLSAEIMEYDTIIDEICIYLSGRIELSSQIDYLSVYITEQEVTYCPELDEVCLIVDRDPGSFSDKQYIEVSQKCNEKRYQLFVSNPTFEFWLLLHNNCILTYNKSKLLENAWHGKKRYLESILAELYLGYRKENIHPERFIFDVQTAMKNEKQFCESIALLKDNLGSNVGCLMGKLIAT